MVLMILKLPLLLMDSVTTEIYQESVADMVFVWVFLFVFITDLIFTVVLGLQRK